MAAGFNSSHADSVHWLINDGICCKTRGNLPGGLSENEGAFGSRSEASVPIVFQRCQYTWHLLFTFPVEVQITFKGIVNN